MNGWLSATAPAAHKDFKGPNLILGEGLEVKVGDGSTVHAQRKGQNYSRSHHVSCHSSTSAVMGIETSRRFQRISKCAETYPLHKSGIRITGWNRELCLISKDN